MMDSSVDSTVNSSFDTRIFSSTPYSIKAETSTSDEDVTLQPEPPKLCARPRVGAYRIPKITPIQRASSFKHPKVMLSILTSGQSQEQTGKVGIATRHEQETPRQARTISRASSLRVKSVTPSTTEQPSMTNQTKSKNDRLAALRAEYQNANPSPSMPGTVTSRRKEPEIVETIFQKIKAFPSTIYQRQNNETTLITSLNWTLQLKKLVEDYTQSVDPIVYGQCNDRLNQFCWSASRAAIILAQIQQDFQFGSLDPNMDNANIFSSSSKTGGVIISCEDKRGNCSLSSSSIPNIADIFRRELIKQNAHGEKIATWKPLSKDDVNRRMEVVKWVFRIAQKLKFAADTVHLTVQIIDLYLGTGKIINGSKGWSLLGLVALRLAGKMEESFTPPTKDLVSRCEFFFQTAEIQSMEGKVLNAINFDVFTSISPLFVNIVAIFGSSCFPNDNIKKLVIDLASGMLYKSLLYHSLSSVKPADKAQAALEIAVEFIFFQYKFFCQRDLAAYNLVNACPGQEFGDFALDMCVENLKQRFSMNKLRTTESANNVNSIFYNNCRNVKANF